MRVVAFPSKFARSCSFVPFFSPLHSALSLMPVAPVSLPLTKRLTVFILASLLFLFHLTLASRLSSFSNSLRSVLGSPGDDQDLEGGEGGRLYGIITLVRIGRVSFLHSSNPRCRVGGADCQTCLSSCGVYVQLESP